MNLGLEGKRALVLASSSGLGLGVATALCREGANVLITGRSEEKLNQAVAALRETVGGAASAVAVDLSAPSSIDELLGAATDKLGGVDILVNNTGGPPPGGVDAMAPEVLRQQFETMVLRVIDLTNRCLPAMLDAGWGRILTITSSGILQPIPNLTLSNTLRSALVGWNKSLSTEVGQHGITANILAPGRIHTARTDQLDAAAAKRQGKTADEIRRISEATIPVGRYGTVDEFGAVAAFLVSAPASYLTGGIIRCDGGLIRGV